MSDETPVAQIHQIGKQMIHLVRERLDETEEYLGLIEGGGICLANSFKTPGEADRWLESMFSKLYSSHRCSLGCMRMPGSEFLCDDVELERLMDVEDTRSA